MAKGKYKIYLDEKKSGWQSRSVSIKICILQFLHVFCLIFMMVLCICPLHKAWQLQKCTFWHFADILPGLLMYMWMGLLLLSDCRKSSWAITRLATESSIWAEENVQQYTVNHFGNMLKRKRSFSLNSQGDTYWTHYTNDSLSQEARIDVICSFSSPLKKKAELFVI